jgi:hypothetical protein
MKNDLETFRLSKLSATDPETTRTSEVEPNRRTKNRLTCRFLRGPIPLPWLLKAAELSGKTPLKLGLALHFQAGLENSKSELRLTTKLKNEFRIPVRSARLAVKKLEAAGLIAVERKAGQCLKVTILDVG